MKSATRHGVLTGERTDVVLLVVLIRLYSHFILLFHYRTSRLLGGVLGVLTESSVMRPKYLFLVTCAGKVASAHHPRCKAIVCKKLLHRAQYFFHLTNWHEKLELMRKCTISNCCVVVSYCTFPVNC